MRTISQEELDKLPYITHKPNDGRTVFLRSFYDFGVDKWVLYLANQEDKLIRLKGGEPIVGTYIAEKAVIKDKDYYFALGTFIIQHLSFPGVVSALDSLQTDLHNLNSILEKYLLISLHPKTNRMGISQLFIAELEYLIIHIRSIYDILQKLSKRALALARQVDSDTSSTRAIDDLPDSFAKVTIEGTRIRSKDELIERYRLLEPIADFYSKEASLFKIIRDLRVSIEHHGKTVRIIYDLDDGMAISTQDEPWSQLPIWRPENLRNNSLGSLRLVFLYLISETINMLSRYAQAFSSCIILPPPICKGYQLYVRDHYSYHLVNLESDIANPWERIGRESSA